MNADDHRLFAVWASDAPGALPARLAVRDAHRLRLRSPALHDVTVLAAGPTLADDATMNGTLLIVRAASAAAVRAFMTGDPYMEAGVYGDIQVRPWTCGLGPWADGAAAAVDGKGNDK
jgi:uncharacterized protein YciI